MTVCAHHWKIEEPNGRTSKAVCANCGAEDEFANSATRPPNPWRVTAKNRAMTIDAWPQRRGKASR